jgi:hypothetical protein
MKVVRLLAVAPGILLFAISSNADDACRYMKSREGLSAYETGGPYALDNFLFTKGRTDLREFLWKHWYEHTKGVAEAKAFTVDRGTVTALYIIQPDAKGHWGIDVELDRPMDQPCTSFHADALVRLSISDPKNDQAQTRGGWPPGEIPKRRLADSKIAKSKTYQILLVSNNQSIGDWI